MSLTDEQDRKFLRDMEDAWPDIVNQLINDKQLQEMRRSLDWVKNLLEVNVMGGKKYRSRAFLKMYHTITKTSERTAEDNYRAIVLAWCLEILHSASLIADDFMDRSKTRRGKPCWYLVEGVGNMVILDVMLLESVVNRLIDSYILKQAQHTAVLRLLHDTVLRSILGQGLDTQTGQGPGDMRKFTLDTYKTVVEYKTSYYTFYAPVALAMIMSGRANEEEDRIVKKVLLQIGYLFQIQDDFLDCYGDPEVTGKIGTDIEEGKCTWLIVKAMEVASSEQLEILSKTYGDGAQSQVVKGMYDELGIKEHFKQVECDLHKEISDNIAKLPMRNMRRPMNLLLNSIYGRDR